MWYLVMIKKKDSIICVQMEYKKNLSLAITLCHQSASLVMLISDPWDGFFYPTLTRMIDSYMLAHQTENDNLSTWDRKSYLAQLF